MFINLLDGIAIGGLLFVLAVGLTLIFGLLDVLNLGHGAFYMVGGYVALAVVQGGQPSLGMFLLLIGIMIVVGVALGLLLDVALRPLTGRDHLTQALLTLGLSMIISEIVLFFSGRGFSSLQVPAELSFSVPTPGGEFPVYRLVVIALSLLIALAAYVVFERTKLGSVTRAAIDDPQILSSLGYNVRTVRTGVIATGSALATIAGLLGAPLLNLQPGLDTQVLTLSLIVVVIGGLGSIKGVAIGALATGIIQTVGTAYLPQAAPYLLFGLMLLVLLLRPQGLFGRAA